MLASAYLRFKVDNTENHAAVNAGIRPNYMSGVAYGPLIAPGCAEVFTHE